MQPLMSNLRTSQTGTSVRLATRRPSTSKELASSGVGGTNLGARPEILILKHIGRERHVNRFGSASAKIVCLVNSSICSKVHGPAQILWVFAYHKRQVHWSGTWSRQRQRRQNHIWRPTDADADPTAPTHEQHLDPFLDGPAGPTADPRCCPRGDAGL